MSEEILSKVRELGDHYYKMIYEVMRKNLPKEEVRNEVKELTTELCDKVKYLINDYINQLKDEVSDYLGVDGYEFIVRDYNIYFDIDFKTFNFNIEFEYSTKFMEISEECSQVESEEEYDECYGERLAEINSEYAYHATLHVSAQNYEIDIYPETCEWDYCRAGLAGSASFKDYHRIESLISDITSKLKEVLERSLGLVLALSSF